MLGGVGQVGRAGGRGRLGAVPAGPPPLSFPAQGAAYDFDWTFLIDPVAPYRTIAPNTGVQPIGSNTNPLLYKQMTTQVSHYIEDIDGTLLLRDGNMGPRRSRKGLLSFNGQWNRAVAPRDLTNAAWVKTNATVTLNQTGRDGTANAASLVTFTADGGTVRQAITNASILRRLLFDIKRAAGSDPLDFSFDDVTWYSITPTGAGWNGWDRAKSALQTLADPAITLRGKAGNSFVIDFVNLMEPREGLSSTIPDIIRLTSATGVGRDRIHHTDTTAGGGPSGEQGINIVRSRYTHGLFVELCYMNPATLVATLGGLSVDVQTTPSPAVLVINRDDAVEQISAPLNLDAGTFTAFNKIFYFRTPTELRLAVNGVLYRTANVRNYTTATTHDFATNGALSALEGFVKRQPWFDDSRVPSDAEMIAWTS